MTTGLLIKNEKILVNGKNLTIRLFKKDVYYWIRIAGLDIDFTDVLELAKAKYYAYSSWLIGGELVLDWLKDFNKLLKVMKL